MTPSIPNEYIFSNVAKYARGKRTLDIGCGNKTYTSVSDTTVTVDGWDKVDPDHLVDLENEDLPFKKNSFECVLMLDFIEHMTRERGEVVLKQAKRIASGRVYLLTPLWWDANESHTNDPGCWAYGNKLNLHLSQWGREDFKEWTEIGFKIEGEEYFFGYWESAQ